LFTHEQDFSVSLVVLIIQTVYPCSLDMHLAITYHNTSLALWGCGKSNCMLLRF